MSSFTTTSLSAPQSVCHVTIRPERPSDNHAISKLCDAVFGPGAHVRAASALRENVAHRADLSFVALTDSSVIGTCRFTPVIWDKRPILMLGPLGVSRAYGSMGIGRRLMEASIAAADGANHDLIFLVGDLAYYEPFGFKTVPNGSVTLPRPADPARILLRERLAGIAEGLSGPMTRAF